MEHCIIMKKKQLIHTSASIAALLMLAPSAFAQWQPDAGDADEGLHPRVQLGVEHDSNVLRVPSSAGPEADTAAILGVGLSFNKRYSLQRIRADIEATRYTYDKHSELSYNTLNYALAWDWSFTPRLHGVLSADRRQFRDVETDPVTATNVVGRRTERTELAEGIYELSGPWRLLAGAQHTSADSTQVRTWDGSPSIREAHVGAGYEFPSGTSLYLRYRHGNGEYRDPSFLPGATKFKDTETELSARWPVTGKTTVEASIGNLKREHDNAPGLDFSGTVGKATVNWQATAKTRLLAGYLRDISGTGLATGGRVTSDRFYLQPTWAATAKTSFNLRYDHVRRDWTGVPAGTPNAGRNESVESIGAGVDWQALRKVSISAYVRQERMTSSLSTGYHANVFGVMGKAIF